MKQLILVCVLCLLFLACVKADYEWMDVLSENYKNTLSPQLLNIVKSKVGELSRLLRGRNIHSEPPRKTQHASYLQCDKSLSIAIEGNRNVKSERWMEDLHSVIAGKKLSQVKIPATHVMAY